MNMNFPFKNLPCVWILSALQYLAWTALTRFFSFIVLLTQYFKGEVGEMNINFKKSQLHFHFSY